MVSLKSFPDDEKDICGYMKIDVEGNELDVLMALKAKIESDMPIISIEINQNNSERVELIKMFNQLGYDQFYVSKWSYHQKNKVLRNIFYCLINW